RRDREVDGTSLDPPNLSPVSTLFRKPADAEPSHVALASLAPHQRPRLRHRRYNPQPVTAIIWPVIPAPPSQARQTTVWAISERLVHRFRSLGFMAATFDAVSTSPGATAFTRIPKSLPSSASVRVRASIPALAQLYATIFAWGSPARPKLMTAPPPASRMCGKTAREVKKALRRLLFNS